MLNPLSIVNSTLTKIQLETWKSLPTSNTLKSSQTQSLNQRHVLCCGRKHTPALALHWEITSLSHGNVTLRVALGRTYKQSFLPMCDVWSIQIYPVWDQEEGHEDILWQRAEGRKHCSVFPCIKNGDSVKRFQPSMPDDQARGESDLHTLKDMRWNDKHQRTIKYWSRDIIKGMRWLMRQPSNA